MKLKNKIKLKTILFALSGLLTVLSVLFVSWYSYVQSSDMLIHEFKLKADIIARNFAYHSFEGVIVQDPFFLDRLLEGVLQEKNLVYSTVFDLKGRLIYKRYKENAKTVFSQNPIFKAAETPAIDQGVASGYALNKKNQNEQLLDIWHPVLDRELIETDSKEELQKHIVGYVRIGVSLRDIEQMKQNLLVSYGAILLSVTVFGLIISYLIARGMERSLAVVIDAMRGVIESDDLSVRLDQNSRIDETASLVYFFNRMTAQLLGSKEKLKESEEKFRTISSSAHDAIIMIDESGLISYWNRSAEKIFGFSSDEVLGKQHNELLTQDKALCEQAHNTDIFGKIQTDETSAIALGEIVESVARKKDGTRISVELSLSRVRLQDQINTITIIRDVSGRKQAEANLKENRQRLELAIHAMDAGLWDWDIPTGNMIVNDRWATMLGYEPGEEGNHISSLQKMLHPEDVKRVQSALDDQLAGNSTLYHVSFRLKMKSGEWKWIQSTGKVVSKSENGETLRAIGTHIDIDKRKQNEIELTRYRMQLEDMVEERTQELKATQDQLVNRAIESGRAQLSAMILHNIGNAITPVGVQVDELKRDEQGKRVYDYLSRSYQDLCENVDRLTEYVNEDARGKEVFGFLGKLIDSLSSHHDGCYLSLDKIAGAVSYVSEIISLQQNYAAGERENRELTDMNRLLDDALKMQSSALEKREIRVEKKLQTNLPLLTIDKNKLMQVIVNLIKNSYEAIDELNGEARDQFIVFRTYHHEDQIGFEITDSGLGVDPDEIDKILLFGESGKGSSGFGLYYCKMFVEANQGRLEFLSEGTGKGATVRLLFSVDATSE